MNIADILSKMFSSDSSVSSMRAMSFLSLVVGSVIAFIGLYRGQDLANLAILVGVFVGSAFGGKVLQKAQEIKGGLSNGQEKGE